jgi:MFS family permease
MSACGQKHACYFPASQQQKAAGQVNILADVCCWCMCAGAVATASALIHDAKSFYILRLLLGVFESGAAPAMWFAVSQFYPSERCVKLLSTLGMAAQSTVNACGAHHQHTLVVLPTWA